MAHASPSAAGTDQQTTRDASSDAFTGGNFKRDWTDTAAKFGRSNEFDRETAESVATVRVDVEGELDADAGDGRYRGAGHPSATGDGHP